MKYKRKWAKFEQIHLEIPIRKKKKKKYGLTKHVISGVNSKSKYCWIQNTFSRSSRVIKVKIKNEEN